MTIPSGLNAQELNALIEVSKTLNAQLDLDTVLETVMSVATDIMGVEASSLVLVDDESGDLLFHTARGPMAASVQPLRMKAGEGIVGQVVESGAPAIVNDVASDPRFSTRIDKTSGFQTKAILCVPLATRNRLWGAIELLNKADGADFDEHDLRLCAALAAHAAIAIEVAMLHKRILQAERMAVMGETMAGLAHCIKNVLNCIRGGAYAVDLGIEKNDTGTLEKGWDIVKRNNTFMEDLVLDMLAYSKERKPEYKATNIDDILAAVCGSVHQREGERETLVKWRTDPKLDAVDVDPTGIRRCLLNLVSNAVDACFDQEEGCVEVCAEPVDDQVFRITIVDNGCGIEDTDRERLFQMFYSTKGSRGTGLGLPVTHKIVTEHGGGIDVESELGRGTTFVITLPMKRQ